MTDQCANYILRLLVHDQRENSLQAASDVLEFGNKDPDFMKEIITLVDTWGWWLQP